MGGMRGTEDEGIHAELPGGYTEFCLPCLEYANVLGLKKRIRLRFQHSELRVSYKAAYFRLAQNLHEALARDPVRCSNLRANKESASNSPKYEK